MGQGKQHIRVLIADGSGFRHRVRRLLEGADDILVVGEATNRSELSNVVHELRPDVLLFDLEMPGPDGLAVSSEMNFDSLPTRVIVLAGTGFNGNVVQAVRRGARGALDKRYASDLLLKSIRKVHAGEFWLENRTTAEILDAYRSSGECAQRRRSFWLSGREKEIAQLAVQGYRNREIAARLFISEVTVKNHLHNIFRKVGVSHRLELTSLSFIEPSESAVHSSPIA